jgi:two-component system sensor histidine kinase QseC
VALGEGGPRQRRAALEKTLEGCDRATRLVEQLLVLSRIEALGAPERVPVDLATVARRVVADAAPAALAKDKAIEFEGAQTCRVQGDEALLEVLVRNLVDNAVRYSPPGARVQVALQAGARAVLWIEDGGPGLSPADRERLGERFFRVAGSGEPGSGLGWSIVRRIAAVHGMSLDIGRSEALGGLAVILTGDAVA